MFKYIKKRDGRIITFDPLKIAKAISKANNVVNEFNEKNIKKLTLKVIVYAKKLNLGPIPEVEEIQDVVEKILLNSPYHKTAKAYIIYREQHAQIRRIATETHINLIENYVQKLDWKVKENSNMCYSLQGLNNYISSDVTAEYWLNKVYPPNICKAHKEGRIHIHDLSQLSVYCVGWDLIDLLKNGFKGVEGKIQSSPAKHLRSALGQITNFFYTLQGEAAGAQALSNFDTLLSPYIYYDKLNYNQIKQALQEFVFNINIPTRVGFQTPFTNVTMDLNIPDFLKNQPIIIGGKQKNKTYEEFQSQVDMFNKAFAEVMMEGDATGRVFTFPIPTYNIVKNFEWDNPNLKALWKMTAKYGVPYFSNFINSNMSPEDTRSMCCRLRLDNRELFTRGGGLFGASPLTGSIGVVTINLPRIGYLTKNETDFFKQLEETTHIAIESLIIKRKILEKFSVKNLYPYSKYYLRSVKEKFGFYWKNHFSTIGIIGMNEACINFFKDNIGTNKGKNFALKTMNKLKNIISTAQEQTGDMFNLEATPGEGAAHRLAMIDKNKYHKIICANDNENNKHAVYYTNSTQLPVNYTDDIFEALELQDDLQTQYTGGTVMHLFLGNQIKDIEIVKSLVKKIATNFRLPYFTITPTFSICPSHGYLNGEKLKCPKCNSYTEVYSRVVGYLRPIKQWNNGKQAEYKNRITFKTKQINNGLNYYK